MAVVALNRPEDSALAVRPPIAFVPEGLDERPIWTAETERQASIGAVRAGHTLRAADAVLDDWEGVILLRMRPFKRPEGGAFLDVSVTLTDPGDTDWGNAKGAFDSVSDLVYEALTDMRRRSGPPDHADNQAAAVNLSIEIEVFVASALRDLENENSELRLALEAARIDAAFLRGQLHALSEARAMDRKDVTKKVLAVIAAVLLAVTTGVSEGIAASRADSEPTPAAVAPAPPVVVPPPSVLVLVERCEAIEAELGN